MSQKSLNSAYPFPQSGWKLPLAVWCLCWSIACAGLAAEPVRDEEAWDVMLMGKDRIGHVHSSVKNVEVDGRKILRTEIDSVTAMQRFGQKIQIRIQMLMDETPEGELLSFESTQQNPPADTTKKVGRIKGDKLELETTINGKTSKKTIPWDTTIKSPGFLERELRENPLKVGEQRELRMFLPELEKASLAKFSRKPDEAAAIFDGTKPTMQRIDVSQSLVPGLVTRTYTDDKGATLKTATTLLGIELSTFRVSKEEALKEIPQAELDVGTETLVKVGPIEKAHQTRKIVYTIRIPDGDPLELIPQSDTQKLTRTGPDSAELTVTAAVTPPAGGGKSTLAPEEFRVPNKYLQADDERVIKHAQAAVGTETDPWKKALLMEKYVSENLKSKNFSTALASAAEVARDLQGDCTEHACLLAAMCRSEKIPARVVVGIVYAPQLQAFGGHMWTEVWVDGRWIPLDATLGKGGIGGGHIRMAATSLSDDDGNPVLYFLPILQVLGKMELTYKSSELPE